jgi:hypothetical protein
VEPAQSQFSFLLYRQNAFSGKYHAVRFPMSASFPFTNLLGPGMNRNSVFDCFSPVFTGEFWFSGFLLSS